MINAELENEAKNCLGEFLCETLDFLGLLVREGVDAERRPFFVETLLPEIRQAWEEFRNDFSLEKAQDLVKKTPGSVLQSHGLYGSQLKLKLSVIASWKGRFFKKRTKKLLLRLLDAIDTLLDSLMQAAGIDKALKEIKEILRNSIDED
jgi:hypothetical protein